MTGSGTDTDTDAATDGKATPAAPSLGRKVGSAAKWSLVNTVVMRLGNFVTGIILARFFLGPEAWGVYGIAQTVLLVLLSANELGVSLAIVRWEGDPRRFAPTVLTLSAVSSCLLYAVLFAAAPAVSRRTRLARGLRRAARDVPVRGARRAVPGTRRVPHPGVRAGPHGWPSTGSTSSSAPR